jgi:branched-chain amino acid aminotransferase
MAFSLELFPVAYRARNQADGSWSEEYLSREPGDPAVEAFLPDAEKAALSERRNCWSDMPLVNYSTQYALSCFEGLKALPQKGGGAALFRPDMNAARFRRSMEGLLMPGFPDASFVESCVQIVKRNRSLGYAVEYESAWEADDYAQASGLYIRPFSYSEGGIGVNSSKHPWVVTVATPVSSYFAGGNSKAATTDRVRAMPRGTGWIKCASNYVMSMLAKKEANEAGFMEVVFLDGREGRYVEEGSSCNFFCLMKSGELVTPELGDTILPGISRLSVIDLARDAGVKVSERKLPIEEVMDQGAEVFVTGTAAGVTPIESVTHKGRESVFNGRKPGPLTVDLRKKLKGIQYGALPDTRGWMVKA